MNDKDIKQKMESLTPLSGGIVFGKEEAWDKLQARIEKKPVRKILFQYWMAAAAVLLLFVSLVTVYNYPSKQIAQTGAVEKTNTAPDKVTVSAPQISSAIHKTESEPSQNARPVAQNKLLAVAKNNKLHVNHNSNELDNYYKTMEFICNGKPCPTEICAIKKIKCQNYQPQAISANSILDADRSGQIPDKSFDNVEANAPITIEELKIKSGTDAEAVILNANSAPAYCVEKESNHKHTSN